MGEEKSLQELVQMAPHLLTRGPERQQRRYKGIKIVWMPGLGKPRRTEPACADSQKGWESETLGSLGLGLGGLASHPSGSQGTPFPTPTR